ncbi:MAG: CheR family methyltransferase [Elainellaceae cyanobacterium]
MSQAISIDSRSKQVFIGLISEKTGLNIKEKDLEAIWKLVSKRIEHSRLNTLEEYCQLLRASTLASQEEWNKLIPSITNAESFFFRDKGQFSLLRRHIVPELINQRASTKSLRICSAGCSTGEEAYSIAILLKELIPDIEQWNITIFGLDINSNSIEKARAGVYRNWSFRGLDEKVIQRFFSRKEEQYEIDESIKNMVVFHQLNLLKDPFTYANFKIEDVDLILCRNVFIYFNESAINEVVYKFYKALRPTGYLIVGHSELYRQNLRQFRVNMFEESVAYQRPVKDANSPDADAPFSTSPSASTTSSNTENRNLTDFFEGSSAEMQKTALNLLRQLPPDSTISRLGNRRVSEMILQLEQSLKET